MGRLRVVAAVLVGLALVLLFGVWLLRAGESSVDTSSHAMEASPSFPGDEVAHFTRPDEKPGTAAESQEVSASVPLAARPAVEPLGEQAAPVAPTRVRVCALTAGGRALSEYLSERWPDLPKLQATWTTDVSGPVPDERVIALGLLPGRGHEADSEHEDLQVPGYITTLLIDAPLPVRVIHHVGGKVIASQVVQPGDDCVCVRMQPQDIDSLTGTVRGRIVATGTSTAPPDASVAIQGTSLFALWGLEHELQRTATAPDGRFEIDGVLAGVAFLNVHATGCESRVLKVDVPRGRGLDLGAIELDAGLSCRGRVVDAQGAPVHAVVALRAVDDSADALDEIRMSHHCESKADGRFLIENLGRDRYVLHAEAHRTADGNGQSTHSVLDMRHAEPSELTIELQPDTAVDIHGLDEDRDWSGIALADESGVLLFSIDQPVFRDWHMYDGKPFILHLPPGHYSVRIARGHGVVRMKDFDVGAEPFSIELPP